MAAGCCAVTCVDAGCCYPCGCRASSPMNALLSAVHRTQCTCQARASVFAMGGTLHARAVPAASVGSPRSAVRACCLSGASADKKAADAAACHFCFVFGQLAGCGVKPGPPLGWPCLPPVPMSVAAELLTSRHSHSSYAAPLGCQVLPGACSMSVTARCCAPPPPPLAKCRAECDIGGASLHVLVHGPALVPKRALIWRIPRLSPQDKASHVVPVRVLGCVASCVHTCVRGYLRAYLSAYLSARAV